VVRAVRPDVEGFRMGTSGRTARTTLRRRHGASGVRVAILRRGR